MIESSNLAATGRLKLQAEELHKDAKRLATQAGGTPEWPDAAVAEAEELVEALAEAARIATKLYAATPAPWKVAQEKAHHG